ncbi:MAG: hypothetical protein CMJ48_11785 [Planctomycetaceae bacterium]|nr:hypothetical protein [Planctomycetaceae bacterium]
MKACACVILALSVLGCAVVDPKADYERVARTIQDATGQSGAYSPDLDEEVESRVEALLEDGLSVGEAV